MEFAGDSEIDVWGSYEIDGMQITFNDEGGEYGADVAGVYEFKATETSLTFSVVDDPVYGRSILMDDNWSKADELRKKVSEMGFEIEDTAAGARVRQRN